MKDEQKSKSQLVTELQALRQQVARLESSLAEHQQVKEALRESKERWRSLTENLPDHIMLLDTDYTIRFINYTVPDLTREQVIGKSNFDFVPADSHQVAFECFERVIQSGKPDRYETRYITAERETQYFDVRILPLADKGGNITGFISTSNNIIKRKRAEEALQKAHDELERRVEERTVELDKTNEALCFEVAEHKQARKVLQESEQYLKEAQAMAHLGHWKLDPTTEEVTGSDELFRIFGLNREEATLDAFIEVVHPDDREFDVNHIRRALEFGEDWDIQHRLVCRDGTEKTVHAIGHAITDETGKTSLLLGTVQDITERKQAEEALRKSEKLLREAQHIGNLGHWVWDRDAEELIWSDEVYRIFGVLPGSFHPSAEAFESTIHPDDLDDFLSKREKMLSEKQKAYIEHRIIRPDGEIRFVAERTELELDEEGNAWRVFGTVQDITEREQAEEALRESRDRLKKAQHIAHMGFLDFNLQTNQMLWSDEVYRLYGIEPVGSPQTLESTVVLVHPDDLEIVQLSLKNAVAGIAKHSIDHRIVRPDGKVIWVHTQTELERDEDGNPQTLFGTVIDITERKQAEEERERLLAAEREQRLLAETWREVALALTSHTNHQAVLEEVLRQTRRLVPYNTANIALLDNDILRVAAWRGYESFGIEKFIANLSHPLSDVMLEKEAITSEQPVVVLDTHQEPRWLWYKETDWIRSYLTIPICYYGRVLGTLRLESDTPGKFSGEDAQRLQPLVNAAAIALENARLYQQAQQDAETKTRLLQEVNHRVKNNLAAITGMLYIEQRHAQQEGNRRTYAAILDDLVNRVKGLSTVHHLLSVSNWSPLPLSKLARQVINSALQGLSPSKRVVVDVSSAAPVVVTPKTAHNLAIVINELTTNVIKYAASTQETTQITVRIASSSGRISPEPDEETILFEFRDNGPGFPAEVLLRSEVRNIGLYLIENTVRHTLRGDITLHNDNGAVATVRFVKEVE